MCITRKELEVKVQEIRKYRVMAEEIEEIQKALELEVITYMNENKLTEEKTDTAKITYKEQSRSTFDKDKLAKVLGADLESFKKSTSYNVLRIK